MDKTEQILRKTVSSYAQLINKRGENVFANGKSMLGGCEPATLIDDIVAGKVQLDLVIATLFRGMPAVTLHLCKDANERDDMLMHGHPDYGVAYRVKSIFNEVTTISKVMLAEQDI